MSAPPSLRVRDVRVCPVVVPLPWPIRTASGSMTDAPLLLIDLQTEEGVTGRSYLFGYQNLALKPLADLVLAMGDMIRRDPVAPLELNRKIRGRFSSWARAASSAWRCPASTWRRGTSSGWRSVSP